MLRNLKNLILCDLPEIGGGHVSWLGVVIEAGHTFMVQRAVFSGPIVRVEWGEGVT